MNTLHGKTVRRPARREAAYLRTTQQVIDSVAALSPDGSRFDWFAHSPQAKAAVRVQNGRYSPELSHPAAQLGGEVDVNENRLSGLRVAACNGQTGGVFVDGEGPFEVDDAVISVSGDSQGIGGPASGAAVDHGGRLVVRNALIDASGLTHYATAAEHGSVLEVYDSVLNSHGAPFGNGEPQPTAPMQTPPPPLMIEGNSRTHCTMTNSRSYFERCLISADGWGALSTESAEGFASIEAVDCKIVTVRRGYVAYADPGCHVDLRHCQIDSADMAGIIGGEAEMNFMACDVRCKANFVVMHSVFGEPEEVGSLTVSGGRVRSVKDAVLVKSRNAVLTFDGADISAGSGVFIRSVVNDDFLATPVGEAPFGIEVELREMGIQGDILHEDSQREMWLSLERSTVRGAIRGAHIALDDGSRWFANADSEATLIGQANPAQFDALAGVTIRLYGNETARYVLASGGVLELTENENRLERLI